MFSHITFNSVISHTFQTKMPPSTPPTFSSYFLTDSIVCNFLPPPPRLRFWCTLLRSFDYFSLIFSQHTMFFSYFLDGSIPFFFLFLLCACALYANEFVNGYNFIIFPYVHNVYVTLTSIYATNRNSCQLLVLPFPAILYTAAPVSIHQFDP